MPEQRFQRSIPSPHKEARRKPQKRKAGEFAGLLHFCVTEVKRGYTWKRPTAVRSNCACSSRDSAAAAACSTSAAFCCVTSSI